MKHTPLIPHLHVGDMVTVHSIDPDGQEFFDSQNITDDTTLIVTKLFYIGEPMFSARRPDGKKIIIRGYEYNFVADEIATLNGRHYEG